MTPSLASSRWGHPLEHVETLTSKRTSIDPPPPASTTSTQPPYERAQTWPEMHNCWAKQVSAFTQNITYKCFFTAYTGFLKSHSLTKHALNHIFDCAPCPRQEKYTKLHGGNWKPRYTGMYYNCWANQVSAFTQLLFLSHNLTKHTVKHVSDCALCPRQEKYAKLHCGNWKNTLHMMYWYICLQLYMVATSERTKLGT